MSTAARPGTGCAEMVLESSALHHQDRLSGTCAAGRAQNGSDSDADLKRRVRGAAHVTQLAK
jgi:hypothetical protein